VHPHGMSDALEGRVTTRKALVDSLRVGTLSPLSLTPPVLLVGAGCSRTAGIPLASDMARQLGALYASAAQLPSVDGPDLLATIFNHLKHPVPASWGEAFPRLFSAALPYETYQSALLRKLLGKARLNWAHACLGHLMARGVVTTVLTTNFDLLLQQGIVPHGVTPIVADGREALRQLVSRPGKPQIGHLHGSITNYKCAVTQEDVESRDSERCFHACLTTVLRDAACLVVVGHSGSDPALMRALRSVAATYEKPVYWLVHENSLGMVSAGVREFMLAVGSGRLILGEDADSFFHYLMAELSAPAPAWMWNPLAEAAHLAGTVTGWDVDSNAQIASYAKFVGVLRAIVSPEPLPANEAALAVGAVKDHVRRHMSAVAAGKVAARLGDPVEAAASASILRWRSRGDSWDARLIEAELARLRDGTKGLTRSPAGELRLKWAEACWLLGLGRRTGRVDIRTRCLDLMRDVEESSRRYPELAAERRFVLSDFAAAMAEYGAISRLSRDVYRGAVEECVEQSRKAGDWYCEFSAILNESMIVMNMADADGDELRRCALSLDAGCDDERLKAEPRLLAKLFNNSGVLWLRVSELNEGDSLRAWHAAINRLNGAIWIRSTLDDEIRLAESLVMLGAATAGMPRGHEDVQEMDRGIGILQHAMNRLVELGADRWLTTCELQVILSRFNRASAAGDLVGMKALLASAQGFDASGRLQRDDQLKLADRIARMEKSIEEMGPRRE